MHYHSFERSRTKATKGLCKTSTCKASSKYAREVLLQQPVVINYRNQSVDETLSELSQLVTELNAIGRNVNQAVKKLHTLDHFPELQTWILLNETSKQLLFKKIDEIQIHIQQMHQQWLQK
jgi:hypothetical protein